MTARRVSPRPAGNQGMTLLELMTVIFIIGILITLLIPAYASIRVRAERSTCANNLRGLYTAGIGCLQDLGHWPQIRGKGSRDPAFALAWVEAFRAYGITHKNWICPTVQSEMHSPDYTRGQEARIDYFPTPFDAKPQTPFKWPNQPWFIERANVHGEGQLIMFTNGQLRSLKDLVQNPNSQPIER